MIREERAKAYAEDVVRNALWSDIEFQSDETLAISDVAQAYLQGTKDADDNPAWRMCEDELPEQSDDYVVVYEDGSVFTEYFIAARKEWKHYLEESDRWISPREKVIAWLPLPKFNHKAEKEWKQHS